MQEDQDAATRYRQHAEEIRVIAAGVMDKKNRKSLLEVAEDYERMARSRDRIDRRFIHKEKPDG